jgi:hypothetical protein
MYLEGKPGRCLLRTKAEFTMTKTRFSKIIRRIIMGLPLAGIVVMNLFPISARMHQFLVMIALIWFQVFILSEVFSPGTKA